MFYCEGRLSFLFKPFFNYVSVLMGERHYCSVLLSFSHLLCCGVLLKGQNKEQSTESFRDITERMSAGCGFTSVLVIITEPSYCILLCLHLVGWMLLKILLRKIMSQLITSLRAAVFCTSQGHLKRLRAGFRAIRLQNVLFSIPESQIFIRPCSHLLCTLTVSQGLFSSSI